MEANFCHIRKKKHTWVNHIYDIKFDNYHTKSQNFIMRLKVFNEKLWQVKIVNNCHNNDILSYRYERKGKIMGKTKLWFFLFFDLSSDFCHNYEVLSIFGVNFYFYLMNCYDIPSRNLEIHLFLEFIFSHFQIFVKFFVYFLFHNSNIYYNYDFFVLFSTFS